MAATREKVKIQGHEIALSNPEKVFYPKAKFTKAQMIDYYARISRYILPHLKDRPVTLKRYPDGVRGEFFYEKDAPSFTPDWVERFSVARRGRGGRIQYILINNLATLVWVANTASIELHPFLHRAPAIDRPTFIVFDLDPGPGADLLTCIRVARLVRDFLAEVKLKSFPKVSGSKGLQVYVPLNGEVTYDITGPFAKAVATMMEQREPNLIVSKMAKELRSNKVFIDWSQNSDFKTTIGVYSLRAKSDRPYVSMPVSWDELDSALKKKGPASLYFEPEQAIRRADEVGDLFKPVLSLKQKVPPEVLSTLPPPDAPKGWSRSAPSRSGSAPLATYRSKRNFAKTPEPKAELPQRSQQGSRRRFVIQKHDASHLHYDFRLEMHGVLKSWAVPKGPPYAPGVKRLAMPTEDHPIEYLDFEGVIPQGQYGGGTVMVWDIGTYELIEGNYYKGFLRLHLAGKKLNGEWTLARSREQTGGRVSWYLEKSEPGMRAISAKRDDQSALTVRSMEQIARTADRTWQSNRAEPPASGTNVRKRSEPTDRRGGQTESRQAPAEPHAVGASAVVPDLLSLPTAELKFVPPMLALPAAAVPEGADWQYEIKLDGYRTLAVKKDSDVTLFSRRGNRVNSKYPAVAKAFGALPNGTIVDGEVVVLDKAGRPMFNALQHARPGDPLFLYAFDLLAYKGKDLRRQPLSIRRQLLEQALQGLADPVRLSPIFQTSAREMVRAVRRQRLEGVVAKRSGSFYESGERSGAWVKYKTNAGQEFVIGGYIPGAHVFDSLLVGYYEGPRLIFLAKVRNGFTPASRLRVARHFKGLETDKCPFANLPEPKNARRGKALTIEVMKQCHWLKPRLVAQVEFTDWTAGNHLRHSRFVGLRDDKNPHNVVRETPPLAPAA